MFNKEELSILLEALNNLPISSNVQSLREGTLKINPLIENLIIKLKKMLDENEVAVGSGSEAPEADQQNAEQPGVAAV